MKRLLATLALLAIAGSAHAQGGNVTADQIMKSEVRLGPDKYEWGAIPVPTVATPGVTKLA